MPKGLNQVEVNLAFTADVNKAKQQVEGLRKSLQDLTELSMKRGSGKGFDAQFEDALVAVQKLDKVLEQSTNKTTGQLDLTKLNAGLHNAGESLGSLQRKMANLGAEGNQAFLKVANSIMLAQKPMKETNQLLDKFWTALKNTARWQFSSSILHGLMGAMSSAYGYAQDLDKSLNSIRIVSGQSADEMAKLAEHANKAAQALSTSTLAYTDAALIYYQQGLDPDEVAKRTETTLRLSNVTGESASEVSSYMTAIWNNFGEGSKNVEYFADVITALGAATASSSKEIAGGMQQFAAVANTVGLSYEYAASALATIVAQTRQSESTVGNGLRTIFARFDSVKLGETLEDGVGLTKYTEALQKAGVSVLDQNGQLKEMDQILDAIGEKWKDLDKTQRTALAQTVGGVRQYTNLMALFDNWDQFQKNLAVAQGAEGSLGEQAEIYAESWEAAKKRVQAAWQAIYQDLIDDKFIIQLLNGFEKILKFVDKLIDSFGGLQGTLGTLLSIFTRVFDAKITAGLNVGLRETARLFGVLQKEHANTIKDTEDLLSKSTNELKKEDDEYQAGYAIKAQIEYNKELLRLKEKLTEKDLEDLELISKNVANYEQLAVEEERRLAAANKRANEFEDAFQTYLSDKGGYSGLESSSMLDRVKQEIGNIDLGNEKYVEEQVRQLSKEYHETYGLSQQFFTELIKSELEVRKIEKSLEAARQQAKDAEDDQLKTLREKAGEEEKITAEKQKQNELAEQANKIEQLKKQQEENERKQKELKEASNAANRRANEALEKRAEIDKKTGGYNLSELDQIAKNALIEQENKAREEQKQILIELNQAEEQGKKLAEELAAATQNVSTNMQQQAKNTQDAAKAQNDLNNAEKDGAKQPTPGNTPNVPPADSPEPKNPPTPSKDKSAMPIGLQIEKWAGNLVKGAQMLSSVQAITGAFDALNETWSNENLSLMDKFSNSLGSISSLGMQYMMNAQRFGPKVALVITGISVAFQGLKWAWDQYQANTPEGKLKAANEALKEAEEKANTAKKAYEDYTSALEENQKIQEEIAKMPAGEERAEAIAEENDKILDLIETYDLWSKIDVLKYDKDGLIILDESLKLDLQKEKSKERQAAYQAKINQLIAEGNAEAAKSKVDKLNITRPESIQKDGAGGVYTQPAQIVDITQQVAKILNEAGLGLGAITEDKDAVLKALANSDNEDIKNNIPVIIEYLERIATDEEQAPLFNELLQTLQNTDAQINAYKIQNAHTAIGSDVSKLTGLSLAQEQLYQQYANLSAEQQTAILDAMEAGNSLVEAWTGAADIIKETTKFVQTDLIDKISQNNAGNNREDVEQWVNSLSEAHLQIAAEMDIDADDTLEEIQHKFQQTLNDHPIELDTNGLTKKQAEALQEEFEQLTDYIVENADAIEALDDHLAECTREASVVARAILRFDDAIQDVTKNYDEWMKALSTKTLQQSSKAAIELQEAYGNLLDMDGSLLSSTFIENTKHLEDMKAAINGDEEAYTRLQKAMGEDIVANLKLDDADLADFHNKLDIVNQAIEGINLKEIKVGADLSGYDGFIGKLQDMVNAAHMTAEQATAYLGSMGIDAEIIEESPKTEKVNVTETEWVPSKFTVVPKVTGGQLTPGGVEYVLESDEKGHWETHNSEKTQMTSPGGGALKIISAHKSSGGGFKHTQASHGGGGVPAGKSGGGGGSKGSEKKRTTKEHKKHEQKTDRYHDIKERIDDLNLALKRLEKTEDRVYGKAKLKYMDQEIEKLEEQIKLTDEYIAEIKKYAKEDQANLRGIGMGAEFDENGRLTNYEQVLANIVADYNSAVDAYNGAADVFNASAQEEADNARLEAADKALSNAKEVYDERLKILDQYEDTYNLLQEKMDERIDQVWQLFDKRLEQITFKIEFEIDWNEKEVKQLEWMLKYITNGANGAVDAMANLSKQMQIFEESINWAKKGISDIFNLHGINFDFDNADPQTLYNQLANFMQLQGLESQLTQKEAEALLQYMDILRDSYDSMYDSWIAIHEKLMESFDEWTDKLNDNLAAVEDLGEELQYYLDVENLVGRDMLNLTTADIDKLHETIVQNAQDQLAVSIANRDALEQTYRARQAYLEEIKKNGASEEAIKQVEEEVKHFKEAWQEAIDTTRDKFINAIEKAQNRFEASLENTTKDYKESFGKMGLDYIQEQFKRQKDLSELYLEDFQKYHELNKTSNELNKSLNNTNNLEIRQKLLDLQDDINGSMQVGVKVSSAQAEIYARRLALLQAEAELLDAQNAKSAVRMTRDNEGNFSYTYTADENQVDDAEQNYGDKFYELLQFERDYAIQLQEEMLQKFQDFIDRRNEIAQTYKEGSDEYVQAMEDLQEEYLTYMDYFTDELNMDMDEMARLRDDDWKDFEKYNDAKLAEYGNFISDFRNLNIGRLMPEFKSMEALSASWEKAFRKACTDANLAVSTYQKTTQQTFQKAGTDIEKYGKTVDERLNQISDESEQTAEAAQDMAEEMVGSMEEIMNEANELDSTWIYVMDSMRNQINETINALNALLQQLDLVIQKANEAMIAAAAAANPGLGTAGWDGGDGGIGGTEGNGDNGGNRGNGNPDGTDDNKNSNNKGYYLTSTGVTYSSFAAGSNAGKQYGGFLIDRATGKTVAGFNKVGFDTGGYTGIWGSEGKLAILHEKEIVLNKEDTSNMLNIVGMVRDIVGSFNLNQRLDSLLSMATAATGMAGLQAQSLDQNVYIEASFPNVQSHSEIELALNNLINSASQYVNRK